MRATRVSAIPGSNQSTGPSAGIRCLRDARVSDIL